MGIFFRCLLLSLLARSSCGCIIKRESHRVQQKFIDDPIFCLLRFKSDIICMHCDKVGLSKMLCCNVVISTASSVVSLRLLSVLNLAANEKERGSENFEFATIT